MSCEVLSLIAEESKAVTSTATKDVIMLAVEDKLTDMN